MQRKRFERELIFRSSPMLVLLVPYDELMSCFCCVCVCVFIGDDESQRKGQVLTLLAEQALHNHDYKASYIHCQDLMAAGRFKLNYLQLIVLSHCFMGERKKACLVVSQ